MTRFSSVVRGSSESFRGYASRQILIYVPWNRSSPFPHPFIIHSHPEWYRRTVVLLGALVPGTCQHNGRPEQKLWIFKRPKLLVEFPYIQPSNLKSVERRKSIFFFKCWFCRPICCPFHSAARDSRITPPRPHPHHHPNNASAGIHVSLTHYVQW